MTTTNISRNQVQAIRLTLEDVLHDIGDKFGLHVAIGTMRFSRNNVRVPVEFSVVRDDGIIHGPEADAFTANAWRYGLHVEELGRWFTSAAGKRVRIIGATPRSKRYPVLCETETGARYKFAGSAVRMYLDKERDK